MRDKFATVAAVFVPLAFVGGLSQGGIGLALGVRVLAFTFPIAGFIWFLITLW